MSRFNHDPFVGIGPDSTHAEHLKADVWYTPCAECSEDLKARYFAGEFGLPR